mgnify:CR=1 FL=1
MIAILEVQLVHIARSRRGEAWLEIARAWSPGASERNEARERVIWRGSIVPERRTILGVPMARKQPCARIASGGEIHLY